MTPPSTDLIQNWGEKVSEDLKFTLVESLSAAGRKEIIRWNGGCRRGDDALS